MRSFSLSALLFLSVLQVGRAASLAANGEQGKVASAWFAGWHAAATPAFPISKISWSKYTHITYAFAETTPDVTRLSPVKGSDPALLRPFVEAAHQHNVKALLSIGGWTGSKFWSSNVGSAENRALFVKTVTGYAKEYNLDGLDFDWEYPAHQGIGCNVISPQDSANFLAFLEELRKDDTGAKLILTAAVVLPFYDSNGQPSKNVEGFARVLDWVAIMNYDIWGPFSPTVGPNAPLYDSCAVPANRVGSANSSVNAWEAAGMPRHKIVLGVPSYGHSYQVLRENAYNGGSLALYPPFNKAVQPKGDAWDNDSGDDVCGNPTGPGGDVDYWGLIALGYLNHDGSPRRGIDYTFDECSKTAYVYNKASQIMVSFDNAQAFSDKGDFIEYSKIRGFSMWEAGGDYDDILLDAIRAPIFS